MIEDTDERLTLSELANVRNSKAPGYEIKKPAIPETGKRYRISTDAYLHGRLWPKGSVVVWDGKRASYMTPIEDETPPTPVDAGKGRPKPSRDVI